MSPGVDAMHAAFPAAQKSIFRLETLQTYAASGEDDDFAAFRRGESLPLDTTGWYVSTVADRTHAGVSWRRVHVVVEPLSEYMAFELCTYADNVAAGEDVRIIPATTTTWPAGLPRDLDFWLFDDARRFDLVYDNDGTWIGATETRTLPALATAAAIRDTALAQSMPWTQFVRRHRRIQSRLPDALMTAS